MAGVTRREGIELAVAAVLVGVVAALHFAGANDVVVFAVAAVALAVLARTIGGATEQLGGRLGSGGAGVVQSALGNLPELAVSLFALHAGLVEVVQASLVGSILGNSVLVLGVAFLAGGLRNGRQVFHSPRARMIATLGALAATIMAIPSLTNEFHSAAAAHEQALSLICAGVLLVLFVVTLPNFLRALPGEEEAHEPPRWSLSATVAILGLTAVGAVFVSDWFVAALQPALASLHMSQTFAGLVVVAIAGNAVENVVGVQLAMKDRPDFAISVILNSSLQVALFVTPVIVFASLAFATTLTLAFPVLLAIALLFAAGLGALVVYDGESTWEEGAILVGLYVAIAASFWWGA